MIPKRTRVKEVHAPKNETVSISVTKTNNLTKERTELKNEVKRIPRMTGADEQNPGYVTAGLSITKNLGDFESLRILCSISVPSIANKDEILKTYHEISAWAEGLIKEEMTEQGFPEESSDDSKAS